MEVQEQTEIRIRETQNGGGEERLEIICAVPERHSLRDESRIAEEWNKMQGE